MKLGNYLDCYYGIAWWMSHFDNMATRTKTKFPLVFQVVYAAVISFPLNGDDSSELDNFLQPGFNFCLFGVC